MNSCAASNPLPLDRPAATEAKPNRLVLLLDIIVFLALFAVAAAFGPRTALWLVGLFIAAVGFALWMVGRQQLGKSFMIGAKAKQLVTSGLYRRFRHPIYLFGALSTFGALFALQIWWLLAIWALYVTPIQLLRLRRENQVLHEEFGDAFLEHRRRTWI